MDRRYVIVIVDDDTRVLESLRELFESAGYSVRSFNSSTNFLNSDYSEIDCLVTDIGMPEQDGFELIEIVRKTRPTMPIFLITARDDPADRGRAAIAGVKNLFRKPFDVHRLLADIDQQMRQDTGGQDAH